jgi:hypothetical protein
MSAQRWSRLIKVQRMLNKFDRQTDSLYTWHWAACGVGEINNHPSSGKMFVVQQLREAQHWSGRYLVRLEDINYLSHSVLFHPLLNEVIDFLSVLEPVEHAGKPTVLQ